MHSETWPSVGILRQSDESTVVYNFGPPIVTSRRGVGPQRYGTTWNTKETPAEIHDLLDTSKSISCRFLAPSEMRFSALCLSAALFASAATAQQQSCDAGATVDTTCLAQKLDFVAPRLVLHGKVLSDDDDDSGDHPKTIMDNVTGCCSTDVIGQIPQMDTSLTYQVLEDAKQAWNGGSGVWPQMSLSERIQAIQRFLNELSKQREAIVIQTVQTDPEFQTNSFKTIGSTKVFIRRAAIGIILCLGPMNYPLNETYATLIPALLMGNVAIMKIPTIGVEAFVKALPPGAMNFVSGRGRETMPPLMKTGDIDGLAFIGGSQAADDLIRQHPHPHRLKVFLQLEAKNMGIFLPTVFVAKEELSSALDQAVLGALSFNGQRCTALKIFFVPAQQGDKFAAMLAKRVEGLNVGLPWQTWPNEDGSSAPYSSVTPLPNKKRVQYMQDLIQDAVSKGAKIMNQRGGEVVGGPESNLMVPAVLYPVTKDMDLYYEEQFGPVLPIATYDTLDTVWEYGRDGKFGQQVSIFVSQPESMEAAMLIDRFSSVFGKININSQCGRSPDTVPFSGRRSSAMGTMSVKHALQEFSIPTVVSYKDSRINYNLLEDVKMYSSFMESVQTK
eukprot:scaffold831_cov109-Cylindrotheca_fusiformis.AAC.6